MSVRWIGLKATLLIIVLGVSLGYLLMLGIDYRLSKGVGCKPASHGSGSTDSACSGISIPDDGDDGLSLIFNPDLTIISGVPGGQVVSADPVDQLIEIVTMKSP